MRFSRLICLPFEAARNSPCCNHLWVSGWVEGGGQKLRSNTRVQVSYIIIPFEQAIKVHVDPTKVSNTPLKIKLILGHVNLQVANKSYQICIYVCIYIHIKTYNTYVICMSLYIKLLFRTPCCPCPHLVRQEQCHEPELGSFTGWNTLQYTFHTRE